MPLPERSDRTGAKLDALAAIALAEERVAIERRIEDAGDEERPRLDGRGRAADRHPAAARDLAGDVESKGVHDAAGGGAEVARGVGGDLDALGGQATLAGAKRRLREM